MADMTMSELWVRLADLRKAARALRWGIADLSVPATEIATEAVAYVGPEIVNSTGTTMTVRRVARLAAESVKQAQELNDRLQDLQAVIHAVATAVDEVNTERASVRGKLVV
jgi:enoyl-CoA hydratase/carnithine racemase